MAPIARKTLAALLVGLLAASAASPVAAQTADPLSPILPLGPAARPKPQRQPKIRRGEEAAAGFKPVVKPLPKPTPAELAEQKKLERDLNICIGC